NSKNNMWCGEHRPGYRSYCHPGNYKGQRIKLYHNNHDGTFTDVSDASGVGKPEAKGMGVVLADFNNDGWPDIAVANDSWPNFLFINPIVGRGIATADFDNDGDIDIVTNNRGDFPSLLRNDGGNTNHWLTILLIGSKSNRDGIGASLKLTSQDVTQYEQTKGGMGYMSASDPRLHFGLGNRTKI